MNIFILSKDPKKCAQMHCDKHVVKMILESAQMLSTVYRLTHGKKTNVAVLDTKTEIYKVKEVYLLDSDYLTTNKTVMIENQALPVLYLSKVYSITHQNHPCTKWVMKSKSNYDWLVQLAKHLNDEYKYRFNHTENHKSWDMISDYLLEIDLPDYSLTKPALAMDDEYKISSGFNVFQTKCVLKRKEAIMLVIGSYRNYYAKAKANLLTYTKRNKPEWLDKY